MPLLLAAPATFVVPVTAVKAQTEGQCEDTPQKQAKRSMFGSILGGLANQVVGRTGMDTVAGGLIPVGSIVAGWAIAQSPQFLPGLTVEEAAAPHSTLVALLVSIAIGALFLIPSLAVLFTLVLRGRFDAAPHEVAVGSAAGAATLSKPLLGVGVGCLAAAVLFLTLLEPGWAHAIGVVALFGFLFATFIAVAASDPAG